MNVRTSKRHNDNDKRHTTEVKRTPADLATLRSSVCAKSRTCVWCSILRMVSSRSEDRSFHTRSSMVAIFGDPTLTWWRSSFAQTSCTLLRCRTVALLRLTEARVASSQSSKTKVSWDCRWKCPPRPPPLLVAGSLCGEARWLCMFVVCLSVYLACCKTWSMIFILARSFLNKRSFMCFGCCWEKFMYRKMHKNIK